jgi:hypothetical protein
MKSTIQVVITLATAVVMFGAPTAMSVNARISGPKLVNSPGTLGSRLPIDGPKAGPGPACPSASECIKQ